MEIKKLKPGDPLYESEQDFLANALDFMERFGLPDDVMETDTGHNGDVMKSDGESDEGDITNAAPKCPHGKLVVLCDECTAEW